MEWEDKLKIQVLGVTCLQLLSLLKETLIRVFLVHYQLPQINNI